MSYKIQQKKQTTTKLLRSKYRIKRNSNLLKLFFLKVTVGAHLERTSLSPHKLSQVVSLVVSVCWW